MEAYGLEPQVVLTTPLLLVLGRREDELVGRATTSRSTAPPEEQFGRTMRIPDELLDEWWRARRRAGADPSGEPMEAKLALARCIVAPLARRGAPRATPRSTSRASCARARAPEDVAERRASGRRSGAPARRCSPAAFGLSTSEARRLIAQGGVKLDGEPVDRARRAPRARSTGRSCRPASGASSRLELTRPSSDTLRARLVCYHPSAAREGGTGKPVTRRRRAFERADTTSCVARRFGGLWCESEAFSLPAVSGAGL